MARLFKDIAGQKRAVNILSAHLNSDSLSHAYLMIGREGTGKEFLANEFSRYILCPQTKEDECETCRKFIAKAHPDFMYINGREGIKIEQIRETIERIDLSPVMSAKKVCLISKAENMGIEAANALLKTLEEPPSDTIIILTTNSEKRLPQTIISRCQIIKLDAVGEKEIFRILEQDFDKEEINRVLSLSEGSIGEAKKLLLNKRALEEKRKMLADVSNLLSDKSLVVRFKIIEEYDKKKKLRDLLEILSRVVFASLMSDGSQNDSEIIAALPKSVTKERQVELGKKILNIYRTLDYNVSLRILLEEMIIKDILSA
jgi:DNA polymerase-3 subunit delta'